MRGIGLRENNGIDEACRSKGTSPAVELGSGVPTLISYIIPAYNAENHIEDTLRSCLAQYYRPLEVVVVDDGSTDDTFLVVERFIQKQNCADFKVVCVRQENRGVSAARNEGIRKCRGAFIGFVDADDVLTPERTSVLQSLLVGAPSDIAYGRTERFWKNEEVVDLISGNQSCCATNVERVEMQPLIKFVPPVWANLMRRELVAKVGLFREDLTYAEDYEYIARVRCQHPVVMRTDLVVSLYRRTVGSVTETRGAASLQSELRAFKLIEGHARAHGAYRGEFAQRFSRHFLRVGNAAALLGMGGTAVEAYRASTAAGEGTRRIVSSTLAFLCRNPYFVRMWAKALKLRGCLRRRIKR